MSVQNVLLWIEAHPGLASWLQAVFSVIAIVAAGLFPFRHERARERTLRRNGLMTFLYLSTQLKVLQVRLLETLQHEGHQVSWGSDKGMKEIEFLEQLAAELPVNILAGFEVSFLVDLRFGFAHATNINKILAANDYLKIRSLYDYEVMVSDQKSQVRRVESMILLLENELRKILV